MSGLRVPPVRLATPYVGHTTLSVYTCKLWESRAWAGAGKSSLLWAMDPHTCPQQHCLGTRPVRTKHPPYLPSHSRLPNITQSCFPHPRWLPIGMEHRDEAYAVHCDTSEDASKTSSSISEVNASLLFWALLARVWPVLGDLLSQTGTGTSLGLLLCTHRNTSK